MKDIKIVDIYFNENSTIRTTKDYLTVTIKGMLQQGMKANRIQIV